MRKVRADLHLHTCLSPCADNQMQPAAIVEQAAKVGLDMIAICDHNSAENVAAVAEAAAGTELAVIAGVEITSAEEVHILGLFDSIRDLMSLQKVIYENLPGRNDPEAFGPQLVVDARGNIVDENARLLIGATTLSIDRIVELIHRWGGLAIASHVDRQRFSIIGQLGFIPEGLQLDAVEVALRAVATIDYGLPVVTSSDAHRLDSIGRQSTCFMIEQPSVPEIAKAFRREAGRTITGNN